MPTWNIALYRNKAVSCGREFLAFYATYPGSIEALRRWIAEAGADRYWACVQKHETHLCDVIFATPARRPAALERFKREHAHARAPSADVLVGMLVLSGWQTCRKAVLQYDRIAQAGHDPPARISSSYKNAALFIAREEMHRPWTQWPPQWGRSPFLSDQRSAASRLPDYIAEIDDFKPPA